MTQPLAKETTDAGVEPDAAIFDGDAFRLTDQEVDLTGRARHLGQTVFAGRAEQWDRDAIFPTENYKDLHSHGLLGICVPKAHGGEGATFRAYCLSAAEIGRYCGTTALTWNMHV
ncbi:MAG: acyl-CoA dehydrogenase family protein, partial [Hyphomicrobiales bacterium]